MAADDTRYTIVSRRLRPSGTTPSTSATTATSSTATITSARVPMPERPERVAQGSKTIPINGMREQIAAEAARNNAAVLPRVFGGTDVVVEAADGDRVAVVLPGALRLIGTRDEAMALAAALLRAARHER